MSLTQITLWDFNIHICATSQVLFGSIAFYLWVNFPVSCAQISALFCWLPTSCISRQISTSHQPRLAEQSGSFPCEVHRSRQKGFPCGPSLYHKKISLFLASLRCTVKKKSQHIEISVSNSGDNAMGAFGVHTYGRPQSLL